MSCPNVSCDAPACWFDQPSDDRNLIASGLRGPAIKDYLCDPVQVDPDIAGAGVIAAYMASAGLAVLCIVLAYISDSLPDNLVNTFDRKLVLNKSGKPRITPFMAKLDRSKRVAAFERFMMALSDQQLATGLAILISSYVLTCKLTAADFQVATSLAWWSSTVHLATLYMLRDYLHRHQIAFFCRSILVVAVYVMLVLANNQRYIIDNSGRWLGLPLSCFSRDTVVWIDSGVPPALILGVFLFLAMGSIAVSSSNSVVRGFLLSIVCQPGRWHIDVEAYNEAYLVSKSKLDAKLLDEYEGKSFTRTIRRIWYVQNGSFLKIFVGAAYTLSYGLVDCIQRFSNPGLIDVSFTNIESFGQLLPMILLVLPCLAVVETLNEITADLEHGVETPGFGLESISDSDVNKLFEQRLTLIKRFCHLDYVSMIIDVSSNDNNVPRDDSDGSITRKRKCLDLLQKRIAADEVLSETNWRSVLFYQGLHILCAIIVGALLGAPGGITEVSLAIILICGFFYIFSSVAPSLLDSLDVISKTSSVKSELDRKRSGRTADVSSHQNPQHTSSSRHDGSIALDILSTTDAKGVSTAHPLESDATTANTHSSTGSNSTASRPQTSNQSIADGGAARQSNNSEEDPNNENTVNPTSSSRLGGDCAARSPTEPSSIHLAEQIHPVRRQGTVSEIV